MAERVRNPLRSEADAFRLLIMFAAAAALVIALAALVGGLIASLAALALLAIGAWRAWGLVQVWRREGSDPHG